jgi:murein DD-endopeptidase MepM/ murein hydrolase activator NlpD
MKESLAMQLLITEGALARHRVVYLSRSQLLLAAAGLLLVLMLFSGAVYHFVFLQAAREGWPVVSQLVRWVVRDEIAQRDRIMRENLDAMAVKVGELQAKLVKLESVGERVSGLAGVQPEELKPLQRTAEGGRGGPYVSLANATQAQLTSTLQALDEAVEQGLDVFTLIESRLFESRLLALSVPSTRPVDGPVGSGFGFRTDPFHGRVALHTGLDFPAETGTPILAAAGGVVATVEWHPQYGQLIELDHGSGLSTRYAHVSKSLVKPGDIVRRGQPIATVGTTGRSTGPHLHFEVLVAGVPQNPARFLAANAPAPSVAQLDSKRPECSPSRPGGGC